MQLKTTFMKLFHLLFSASLCLSLLPLKTMGWSEHPMLVGPSLQALPVWSSLAPVRAKSLTHFLMDNETELAAFLADQEIWSKDHLPNYLSRPESLAFVATEKKDDILKRFFYAIRLNPAVKLPLYLHLLPSDSFGTHAVALPQHITTLSKLGVMAHTRYVFLEEGEYVSAFEVLRTASDEPDYGFDLGLFENNSTDYGKIYGFGKQPFGNPNLEYGSQAPFHMGFYHESKILYAFGPFLKNTFADYRINLYRALSLFAFQQGEDYWGWRFMGWSMHHLGDLSMPYHSKPLPAVSTLKMIWINLKAMLGWKQSKTDAVQLVSNKHTVLEEFQWEELRKALTENDLQHPFLRALRQPDEIIPYSDLFIYDVVSKKAADQSISCNDALLKFVPQRFVSDPSIEVGDLPEMDHLVEVIRSEKGEAAVNGLNEAIAERMRSFSMAMRSFLDNMLLEIHRSKAKTTLSKTHV